MGVLDDLLNEALRAAAGMKPDPKTYYNLGKKVGEQRLPSDALRMRRNKEAPLDCIEAYERGWEDGMNGPSKR